MWRYIWTSTILGMSTDIHGSCTIHLHKRKSESSHGSVTNIYAVKLDDTSKKRVTWHYRTVSFIWNVESKACIYIYMRIQHLFSDIIVHIFHSWITLEFYRMACIIEIYKHKRPYTRLAKSNFVSLIKESLTTPFYWTLWWWNMQVFHDDILWKLIVI